MSSSSASLPSSGAPALLARTQFFVREHVGLLKLSESFDILDPRTNAKIGEAREEIDGLLKFLRLLVDKSLLPTRIAVYEVSGDASRTLLFSIKRGFTLLRPKIEILDAHGQSLGFLRSKLLSLGGAFRVFAPDGTEVALVKGDWKGWNFRFLSGDTELGVVTKQWAGLGKELFTSADNYIVSLNGSPSPEVGTLLLAAGLAIDTVLKENK